MKRAAGIAMSNPSSRFRAKLEAYKNRVLKTDKVESGEKLSKSPSNSFKRQREASSSSSFSKRPKSEQHDGGKGKGRQGKREDAKGDPSMEFAKNPLAAPVCREASRFVRKELGFSSHFKIYSGSVDGWRTSAKLSVRGNPPSIGLFAPGSHRVIPLLSSRAHHPSINEAVSLISQFVHETGFKGYDGKNPGGLSYLCANVETGSKRVQVIFVVNASDFTEYEDVVKQVLDKIEKNKPDLIHSAWIHCNPAKSFENNIFSFKPDAWKRVHGPEFVQEQLHTIPLTPPGYKSDVEGKESWRPSLFFGPFVFRQANTLGFSRLVSRLKTFVSQDARVVELYGGVGTIGLHLLDKVSFLSCSDENPFNVDCFNRTVSKLPKAAQEKAHYTSANAAEMVRRGELKKGNVVIVDPPRKGLDESVVQALLEAKNVETLIYVSCGFKAFQRDSVKLIENGEFRVDHAEGHLLFPGANHIETLAVFRRGVGAATEKKKKKNQKKKDAGAKHKGTPRK